MLPSYSIRNLRGLPSHVQQHDSSDRHLLLSREDGMKRYVRVRTEKTIDGDKLQVVEVFESKCDKADFIIFLEK